MSPRWTAPTVPLPAEIWLAHSTYPSNGARVVHASPALDGGVRALCRKRFIFGFVRIRQGSPAEVTCLVCKARLRRLWVAP